MRIKRREMLKKVKFKKHKKYLCFSASTYVAKMFIK